MTRGLAFLLLAAAALVGPAADAKDLGSIVQGPRNAFRDDVWNGGEPLGTRTFLRPLWSGVQGCADRLRSCPRDIRRAEVLTSTAADASPNRTDDVNGHALGVSGMVIVERAEPSDFFGGFGVTTTWDVGGEQVLDDSGWRAWEALYPDASPNAKWLPIQSYAFAFATPQAAVPEAPTWALLGVGFMALASAVVISRRPV